MNKGFGLDDAVAAESVAVTVAIVVVSVKAVVLGRNTGLCTLKEKFRAVELCVANPLLRVAPVVMIIVVDVVVLVAEEREERDEGNMELFCNVFPRLKRNR